MISLTMRSLISGQEHTREIPLSFVEYSRCCERYAQGALIQDAFAMLSPEDREFIKTGITPEEWEALFAREEK